MVNILISFPLKSLVVLVTPFSNHTINTNLIIGQQKVSSQAIPMFLKVTCALIYSLINCIPTGICCLMRKSFLFFPHLLLHHLLNHLLQTYGCPIFCTSTLPISPLFYVPILLTHLLLPINPPLFFLYLSLIQLLLCLVLV